MRKVVVFLICFIYAIIGFSKGYLTESQIDSLRKKYPNFKTICVEKQVDVSFKKEIGRLKPYYINVTVKEAYVNLYNNTTFVKSIFYDNYSSWGNKVQTLNKKGKPSGAISLEEKGVMISGIFHHDVRRHEFSLREKQNKCYGYLGEKKYKKLHYFNKLYISERYPVLKCEVTLRIPKGVEIDVHEFNFEQDKINKEIVEVGKNRHHVYTFEEVEPYVHESNILGKSWIMPHFVFNIKSYTKADKRVTFFETTNDIYSWYKELIEDLDDEVTDLKEKSLEIIQGKENDIEKVKALFYWVQKNIRYLAYEDGIAGFKPEKASQVLYDKYGDCKGMANLLTVMLKSVGYDARRTWLGTKHLVYDYSIPSLVVDNHMITSLFLNDTIYYLDPTEKYIGLNCLAERIQGQEVMIENGDTPLFKKIPIKTESQNIRNIRKKITIDQLSLYGKIMREYFGEDKSLFLSLYNRLQDNSKDDALKDYLKDLEEATEIDSIEVEGINTIDDNLNMKYYILKDEASNSFENKIYVPIDLDKELSGLVFDSNRVNDFVFDKKFIIDSETIFKLPEGKEVEYIPGDFNFENEKIVMKINFVQNGRTIKYIKLIKIKNTLIKKEEFPEWNRTIENLMEIYDDYIVIR